MTLRKEPANERAKLAANRRATQEAWLRYRPFVEQAHRAYPRGIRITPQSVSASTFESRFREAVRGALAFGYDFYTSADDLRGWWDNVIVRTEGHSVYIGLRPGKDPDNAPKTIEVAPPREFPGTITEAERDAIALLVSTNRLPSGTSVDAVWPGWDPQLPNVVVVVQDGKTIFI